jgi:hypothetical protein
MVMRRAGRVKVMTEFVAWVEEGMEGAATRQKDPPLRGVDGHNQVTVNIFLNLEG